MTLQENRAEIAMILTEAAKMTEDERAKLYRELIRLEEAPQTESTPPALEAPEGASNG